MLIGKITSSNIEKIIDKVRLNCYFQYSSTFDYAFIENYMKNNGYYIEYCKPGTIEYRKYGCRAFKIVSENFSEVKQKTINEIIKSKSNKIIVKNIRLNENKILHADKIVAENKPRTSLCRKNILNILINEGFVSLYKKEAKGNKINAEFIINKESIC